ncbi:alpha/beta fold hydrolase [Dongia deserti]|uniref:alpha/beta fold hydrolase n=1 Tax=Dongia deserti TaxID=2268030 RepID=UPI000E6533F7|nr:alpha/beta hydrolase [Dongia deserti]
MNERMIRADGVALATQSFGDPAWPPIFLIMGGMASMLWWPEALCERLASHGRYVIRYDNRDTGRSTKYPPGEPGYTFDDMVDDVFRVLDGYAIPAAHIVGMSLGAMIGQVAAIKRPSRVLSLTAISSTPVGTDTSHLPQFSEAFMAQMEAAEKVDWSDRSQVIACMIEDSRVLAGTAHPFDEAQTGAFIAQDYDRSGGYLSATNHGALKIGDAWRGRLSEMKVPLLVIHGTADPVYPIEHGETLAEAVASARLVRLEGGGHELHLVHWDTIVAAIVQHTAQ